jgi:hypothetical protein
MMFSQGDRVIKPFWKNLQQKESQNLVSLYWKSIKLWLKVWHNTYGDWDCQKIKWIQLKSNFDYLIFIFHVDICRRNLDISCPTPPTPISIVWSARSFPPSLLRFDSALNVDFTQFKTNLVPRIYFPLVGYALSHLFPKGQPQVALRWWNRQCLIRTCQPGPSVSPFVRPSVHPSVCLLVWLSVCLSVCPPVRSTCLSVCLSVHPVCLSIQRFVSMSICSSCLSIHLPVCLSVPLPICCLRLSDQLSVCVSVRPSDFCQCQYVPKWSHKAAISVYLFRFNFWRNIILQVNLVPQERKQN